MNCFIFLPTLDYLIELFYAFIMNTLAQQWQERRKAKAYLRQAQAIKRRLLRDKINAMLPLKNWTKDVIF